LPKIMIVDDDRTTTTLLETLLSMDGFDVVLVARGNDVLKLAHREHPDIFLIDYHLADVDGTEVVEALRADPQFANAPIVVASGMNVEPQSIEAGASMFMVKPLNPGTLAETLHGLL
jgi:DNA-binding response OmpR family regulator